MINKFSYFKIYFPHAIQLILAKYNSVSPHVPNVNWNPLLDKLVTTVLTRRFASWRESSPYKPYVTVGVPSNGEIKSILWEWGHLAVGLNPSWLTVPDTPVIKNTSFFYIGNMINSWLSKGVSHPQITNIIFF